MLDALENVGEKARCITRFREEITFTLYRRFLCTAGVNTEPFIITIYIFNHVLSCRKLHRVSRFYCVLNRKIAEGADKANVAK